VLPHAGLPPWHTDDERAFSITDAIAHICRHRRQVFYFTAQADEVEKLRLAIERFNDSQESENQIGFSAMTSARFCR